MTEQIFDRKKFFGVRDFAECIFIKAITKKAGDKLVSDVPEMASLFTSGPLRIVFQVNGVDLPFKESLNDIKKQLDEMVMEAAKKLLDEKLGDIWDKLDEAAEDFKIAMGNRLVSLIGMEEQNGS